MCVSYYLHQSVAILETTKHITIQGVAKQLHQTSQEHRRA